MYIEKTGIKILWVLQSVVFFNTKSKSEEKSILLKSMEYVVGRRKYNQRYLNKKNQTENNLIFP